MNTPVLLGRNYRNEQECFFYVIFASLAFPFFQRRLQFSKTVTFSNYHFLSFQTFRDSPNPYSSRPFCHPKYFRIPILCPPDKHMFFLKTQKNPTCSPKTVAFSPSYLHIPTDLYFFIDKIPFNKLSCFPNISIHYVFHGTYTSGGVLWQTKSSIFGML